MPFTPSHFLTKTIVLVGLMGSGKSTIGSRLAKRLGVAFSDIDREIEHSLNCSISDIFAGAGETYFRQLEKRTVADLLLREPHVMATGGGAFIQEGTRQLIKERGLSIWLKADLDVLLERVSRKNTRPLLEVGDKREILEKLMDSRYPIYAEADIIIDSGQGPHSIAVDEIIKALALHQKSETV